MKYPSFISPETRHKSIASEFHLNRAPHSNNWRSSELIYILYHVWCHYYTLRFIDNPHNREPIPCKLDWDIECFFMSTNFYWYNTFKLLQCCLKYHVTLDRDKTASPAVLKITIIVISGKVRDSSFKQCHSVEPFYVIHRSIFSDLYDVNYSL